MRIVVFVLAGLMVVATLRLPGAEQDERTPSQIVQDLLALPSWRRSANGEDVRRTLRGQDGRELLLDNWRVADGNDRAEMLALLTDFCAPQRKSRYYALFDTAVARTLVRALDDESLAVRSTAARLLAGKFDEQIIRLYRSDIVNHVQKHQNTDAILLLGRTGCKEAENILRSESAIPKASKRATEMALAKLGDTALEAKFIQEFKTAQPDKKIRIASDLGYIGTLPCCVALAEELRSSAIVTAGANYSLRVFIIEALHEAFPWEPILSTPSKAPLSDDYYEAIEKWAVRTLDVSWNEPRPPFFYAMDRPGRPH